MAILTRAELEQRLGAEDIARLADRDSPAGEDASVVDAALSDAEAEVMAYVSMVTASPLPDPAPVVLKRITATVARYNLWRRDTRDDHPAYLAYRDAVDELKSISKGLIALPLADAEQSNASVAGGGVFYSPGFSLTDAAMAGMMP